MLEELKDVFEMRTLFETFAITRAAERGASEQLPIMRGLLREAIAALEQRDIEGWYESSQSFHDAIIASAGNQQLKALYDLIKLAMRRYQSVDKGQYRETAPITFNDFADRYLAEYAEVKVKRGDLKRSTLDGYQSMLATHLRPFFGAMKLSTISPAVVRHFAREEAEALGRGDLKPKSYNNILTFLKGMLRWGVKVGYLATNPAADEERARVDRHEMDFLSPEEIRLLLAHATEPHGTLFHLAVFTGLPSVSI